MNSAKFSRSTRNRTPSTRLGKFHLFGFTSFLANLLNIFFFLGSSPDKQTEKLGSSRKSDAASKNAKNDTVNTSFSSSNEVGTPRKKNAPETPITSSGSSKENDKSGTTKNQNKNTRGNKEAKSNQDDNVSSSPATSSIRILSPQSEDNSISTTMNRSTSTPDTTKKSSTPKKASKQLLDKFKRVASSSNPENNLKHRTRRAIAEEFANNNIITRKRLSAEAPRNSIKHQILASTINNARRIGDKLNSSSSTTGHKQTNPQTSSSLKSPSTKDTQNNVAPTTKEKKTETVKSSAANISTKEDSTNIRSSLRSKQSSRTAPILRKASLIPRLNRQK